MLVLPVLAYWTLRRFESGVPVPPKKVTLAQTAFFLAALFLISAHASRTNRIALLPGEWPAPEDWLFGAMILATLLGGAMGAWRKQSPEHLRRLKAFLPEDRSDLGLWAVVSLLAGVAEEYAYRGLLYQLMLRESGSWAIAMLVSAAAFGGAHLGQGRRAALMVMGMGLVFQLSVFLTGTLYVAMGVHFLYDLLIGIFAMRQFQAEAAAQAAPQAEAAQA